MKDEFKELWDVRIVYYYDKHDNNLNNFDDTYIRYTLYLNKNFTMSDILNFFNNFLNNQRLAVLLCFGNDIGNIILNYFPKHLNCNHIYTHEYLAEMTRFVSYRRVSIPNNVTINRLGSFFPYGYSLLRIRNLNN